MGTPAQGQDGDLPGEWVAWQLVMQMLPLTGNLFDKLATSCRNCNLNLPFSGVGSDIQRGEQRPGTEGVAGEGRYGAVRRHRRRERPPPPEGAAEALRKLQGKQALSTILLREK